MMILVADAPLLAQQRQLRDDDVVARVNGTPIFRKSVKDVVQGGIIVQQTEPDAATVTRMASDALQSLIALELLYQESQQRGITVSDQEVTAEIERSKQRFPDAKSFAEALEANRMSEADLRRDTRKTMAVDRLLAGGVWRDAEVTPEQVRQFYEQNASEFRHPAQTRASRILIRVPAKANAAQRTAARQQADTILERLRGGADFAQVARESSQDPLSAPKGGDLGFFAEGEMEDAVQQAASHLSPGELSAVISTPYGFEIIEVTGRRDAGTRPLAEVEDLIREVLTKSERQERQAALVRELKQKAKIEMVAPLN
jgi:peptidyl-prolyl cis-trans isomerase C